MGVFVLGIQLFADYVSHQYHYADTITLSECINDAKKVFKSNGLKNIYVHRNKNYPYAVVSAINPEGYTFQYTCESQKGFAYLIVNGPRRDMRNKFLDKIGEELKELHKSHNK